MPGPRNLIPGVRGKDYRFVRYGGRVYVVYRVKLPNGKYVNLSWKVEQSDYKALGVDPANIRRINKSQFRNLNYFGSASEIARTGSGQHPFQGYLKELRERYGAGVSWIDNKEFMSVMLMGWAENWGAAELEQRLKRTDWYQSRTDAERRWELEMGKADRKASIETTSSQVRDALGEMYGEAVDWTQHYDEAQVEKIAERIASGHWGDPADGFQTWFSGAMDKASKIEGTAAWIQKEQEGEAQRGYLNRPEDIREQIRQEAFEWLGPKGTPDDETLTRWSKELASEVKSDGDWLQFLQTQAASLYPWLGPQERWQDRASVYKRIIEENFGSPVGWDHDLLFHIGEQNPTSGEYTGNALAFDQFEQMVRSRDEFWRGPTAQQEGFELLAEINDVFRGVR